MSESVVGNAAKRKEVEFRDFDRVKQLLVSGHLSRTNEMEGRRNDLNATLLRAKAAHPNALSARVDAINAP